MAAHRSRDVLLAFLFVLAWDAVNGQRPCTASCVFTRETGKTDCESRQLTCIPLNYPGSVVLMLAQNSLQMVPRQSFANYRMLRQLDLSNNAIYSIEDNAFNGLGGVSTLNLANNRITQLTANTFRGLRAVQTLHLQGNAINAVAAGTFREMTNIIELNLSGNRLSILPHGLFSQMLSLRRLFLQENQLTTDPNMPFLDGLSNLVELDLDGNRFTNIPSMNGLMRLTDLDITDTHIKYISNNSFSDLSSVRDIILNNNMISMIEPGAFSGLGVLSELDISFNVISELDVQVFQPLYNVERLQLQNNQLRRLATQHFASMTRLTSLNLEGNQITVFPPMPNLRMLNTLNLRSNRLDTFAPQTMQSMPMLKRILLVGNPIQCDCRVLRLREYFLSPAHATPYHPNEIPTCNAMQPRHLRGTRLTAVQTSDLQCHAPVLRPFSRMISTRSGGNATLACASSGFPVPKVTWVAPNGLRLRPAGNHHLNRRIRVTEDGMMLIAYATQADQGQYSCIMGNPAGQVQGAVRLLVQPSPAAPPEPPVTNSTMSKINPPGKPSTHNPMSPPITTNTQEIPINGDPYVSTTIPDSTINGQTWPEVHNSGGYFPHQNPHFNHTSTQLNPTIVIGGDVDKPADESPDSTTPRCSNNMGSRDVVAAVLLTFLFTASLIAIIFFLWYRRWLPRVLLSGKRRAILTLSGRRRMSSKVPRPTQIPHARRLRSYERVDESRGASSYFSDSEDTLSTSSSYDSARYVITDNSVADPDSIRIRQIKLAAVSAKAPQIPRSPPKESSKTKGHKDEAPPTVARSPASKNSSVSTSGVKLPGPLAALKNKAMGRKTHIYQNADMVVHDPNYSALWPGPKQDQYQYPRKHSGESRIYIDLS
ncbi:leucine-rich repeat and immunoglobulin-like domain-containing nogo receptor-interacting protein 3 [Lytechinus pictus]|uniref:leucine-rich repeat and immunoglobulin-like domain-containing nogo receptor-interacting protein 3 n=1 Tax=Lytechinus pictus TaxID=7653 RepID=UPI0030B9ED8A